jgi:hypothetical protein
MGVGRGAGTFSLLNDGRILAVGGYNGTTTHSSAELWDPGTGTWSITASLAHARVSHTSSVLASGKVLVAGGYDYGTSAYLTSAELYTFDDTPPTITITTPPEGAAYALDQVVLADYACQDEGGGSGLDSCIGDVADGSPIDTASVGPKTLTVSALDNAGNSAAATHNYSIVYGFSGFFQPVDNFVFNVVKAGSGIPVKFSLSGDRGLSVFAVGFPQSMQVACNNSAPQDDIEETLTAGGSSLSYDAVTDRYTYVWKTHKGWANTCRKLTVRLSDVTDHVAYFTFTK